jgi:hypothetical protein
MLLSAVKQLLLVDFVIGYQNWLHIEVRKNNISV